MKLLHIQDSRNCEYIATFEVKDFAENVKEVSTTVDLPFLQFAIANNAYLKSEGKPLLLSGIEPDIYSFVF